PVAARGCREHARARPMPAHLARARPSDDRRLRRDRLDSDDAAISTSRGILDAGPAVLGERDCTSWRRARRAGLAVQSAGALDRLRHRAAEPFHGAALLARLAALCLGWHWHR